MYPWGDVPGCKAGDMACLEKSAIDGSHCPLLQQHTQGDQEGLADVTAYPQGASPFGVMDLVGNVSGAVVLVATIFAQEAQCSRLSILCAGVAIH